MLKSDAKGSGGGNHMLLGCMCLTANTVSMVRMLAGQGIPEQPDTQTCHLIKPHMLSVWTDCNASFLIYAGTVLYSGKAPCRQV